MISCVIKMNQINVKNIVKIIINGSVVYFLIKFFVFSMSRNIETLYTGIYM